MAAAMPRLWRVLTSSVMVGVAAVVGVQAALAQAPAELVKDIDSSVLSGGSDPASITPVGPVTFFVASSPATGYELWRTDGTAAGTVLVKDIVPGWDYSDPHNLTNVNGTLFFVANDGSSGSELWKSDGTAAGTVQVADVRPGAGSSGPSSLTVLGSAVLFSATDDTYGTELWKVADIASCGDGAVDPGEACDDGNFVNGDGCDNACTPSACGNGYAGGAEQCDDGNTNNNDACKNDCTVNVCGDGVLDPLVEACDDGNTSNTDGCTNACVLALCGDGYVQPGEICDDGNADGGECCAATCQAAAADGTACDDGNVCTSGSTCSGGACGALDSCSDGNPCTNDFCDRLSGCYAVNNVAPCDDGAFCNGADTCTAGTCGAHAGDPCTAGPECNNVCNESADTCAVSAGTPCTADSSPCSLDECDGAGACTHPGGHAGVECRAVVGPCDLAEACDGSSPSCPPDGGVPDSDGDTLCDTIDPCTNVGGGRDLTIKPKVTVGKIDTDPTPGNDSVSVGGEFVLPASTSFAALDPQTDGARVMVVTATGVPRIDVTLPGGVYAGNGTRGWTLNGPGTKWTFQDKTGAPGNGIVKVVIQDRSARAPRQVKLLVKGKNGAYPVVSGDEPVTAIVVLGGQAAAGECGETAFAPGNCSFNGSGNKLLCKP